MTDIVARLLDLDKHGYQPMTGAIGAEAAAEIKLLRNILYRIVVRRADGSMVICPDEYVLAIASKYMKPNVN
jgi:hypothetical protein